GLLHFDRELGGGEAGGIHDIGPVDEFGERRRIKAKPFRADTGQELGAGRALRVVELLAAAILAKMLGVGGGEEGAEVVVEPPGDAGIGAVLEIHNGVVAGGELGGIEKRAGGVAEAAVLELRLAASAAIEFGENGGGGGAVKAMIVEKDPNVGQKTLLRAQDKDPLGWAGLVAKSRAAACHPVGKRRDA